MVGGRSFLFEIRTGVCWLLAVIAFLTAMLWLAALGRDRWFTMTDAAKADIAVVLAGDYWDIAFSKAAELVRQGYVPTVLVSGPPGFYGVNEADAGDSVRGGQGLSGGVVHSAASHGAFHPRGSRRRAWTREAAQYPAAFCW